MRIAVNNIEWEGQAQVFVIRLCQGKRQHQIKTFCCSWRCFIIRLDNVKLLHVFLLPWIGTPARHGWNQTMNEVRPRYEGRSY